MQLPYRFPIHIPNKLKMASLFASSSSTFVSLSHPKTPNSIYFSSSQTPNPPPSPPQTPPLSANGGEQPPPAVAAKPSAASADSTDWIASTLTRRFGIGAGLAWFGFLAVGVVSEQIKTRLEVSQQQESTRDVDKEEEVVLPNGIKYVELRVGGGSSPKPGDLVVINVKGSIQNNGQVFVDTFESRKPLALVAGSRPYSKGICEGIEIVLRSMKAGGKRRVIVPPSLGFGEDGAEFGDDFVRIPPFATLEYVLEVDKVSIAPA